MGQLSMEFMSVLVPVGSLAFGGMWLLCLRADGQVGWGAHMVQQSGIHPCLALMMLESGCCPAVELLAIRPEQVLQAA